MAGVWKVMKVEDVTVDPKWLRVERHTVDTGRAVIKDYYMILRNDCAIVIAPAPDGRIICTREYAHGAGRRLLRFPSGICEEGEAPIATAARELEDETGYVPSGLTELCVTMPSPDNMVKRIHVFAAKATAEGGRINPEPTEDVEVVLMDPAGLDKLAREGGIVSSEQAAAWLAARRMFVK